MLKFLYTIAFSFSASPIAVFSDIICRGGAAKQATMTVSDLG
jgi:hypothetical protein